MRMAGVSLSAGCLTLVIAGLFVGAGFLIDRSAGTGPALDVDPVVCEPPVLAGRFVFSRTARDQQG